MAMVSGDDDGHGIGDGDGDGNGIGDGDFIGGGDGDGIGDGDGDGNDVMPVLGMVIVIASGDGSNHV